MDFFVSNGQVHMPGDESDPSTWMLENAERVDQDELRLNAQFA